jgi:hypothetical protein
MDAEAKTSGDPSDPPGEGSESASSRVGFDDDGNGDGANPATNAARQARAYFAELKSHANYFVSAKVDGVKARGKKIAILAALGLVGLLVAVGVLFSAAFLLLAGIANGLGALFHHLWLGQLVVGFVVLAAVGLGAWIALKKITSASRKQTEQKYASKRNQQRAEFGHDVHERARR